MTLQAEAELRALPNEKVAEDDQLVRRCKAGDSTAFGDIVDKYKDHVVRTAMFITRDQWLADDLTQEALMRAWEKIHTFRPGRPLMPWLLTIVRNCARSYHRKPRVNEAPETLLEGRASQEPGPEAVYLQAEEHERVRRALETLDRDAQLLFYLRCWQDLSVPEIAQVMGLPQGTVKSRLNSIGKKLRNILEGGSPP
jgi:RNA polymerase sigma-70 factor (ECF subfamily)